MAKFFFFAIVKPLVRKMAANAEDFQPPRPGNWDYACPFCLKGISVRTLESTHKCLGLESFEEEKGCQHVTTGTKRAHRRETIRIFREECAERNREWAKMKAKWDEYEKVRIFTPHLLQEFLANHKREYLAERARNNPNPSPALS